MIWRREAEPSGQFVPGLAPWNEFEWSLFVPRTCRIARHLRGEPVNP